MYHWRLCQNWSRKCRLMTNTYTCHCRRYKRLSCEREKLNNQKILWVSAHTHVVVIQFFFVIEKVHPPRLSVILSKWIGQRMWMNYWIAWNCSANPLVIQHSRPPIVVPTSANWKMGNTLRVIIYAAVWINHVFVSLIFRTCPNGTARIYNNLCASQIIETTHGRSW
jgi:hypothetical protein